MIVARVLRDGNHIFYKDIILLDPRVSNMEVSHGPPVKDRVPQGAT